MDTNDKNPLPCPICGAEMIKFIQYDEHLVRHQHISCPVSHIVFLQSEVDKWNDRPTTPVVIPDSVLGGLEELHFGKTAYLLSTDRDYNTICAIFRKMIVAFCGEEVYDKALRSKFKSNGVDDESTSRKDT